MTTSAIQLLLSAPPVITSALSDYGEERSLDAADTVKLLMLRGGRTAEACYRGELTNDVAAQIPPGIPGMVVHGRMQPADGLSFQVRIAHVRDDQSRSPFSALCHDQERALHVQQDCSHDGNIELAKGVRKVVD